MPTYFLKQVATSNLYTKDNKGNNSYTEQYYNKIDQKNIWPRQLQNLKLY